MLTSAILCSTSWANIRPTGNWSLCGSMITPLRMIHIHFNLQFKQINFMYFTVFVRNFINWNAYCISLIKMDISTFYWLIIDSHNGQLPGGLLAQLVELCTGIAEVRVCVLIRSEFFMSLIHYCSFSTWHSIIVKTINLEIVIFLFV